MKKLFKLIKIIKTPHFLRGLFKGVPAATEHIKVLKNLNCDFIVDIGANKGQFALLVRSFFPTTKILSFEPLAEPANIFLALFKDDANVILHQIAIGSSADEALMHVSNRIDSSSLLPISARQTQLFPGTEENCVKRIKIAPLHFFSEDMEGVNGLLKIDVQGYELSTLRGCKKEFHRFSYIYVECSFVELYEGQSLAYEVIEYLNGNNFILVGVFNLYFDHNEVAIQGDFLFKKFSKEN